MEIYNKCQNAVHISRVFIIIYLFWLSSSSFTIFHYYSRYYLKGNYLLISKTVKIKKMEMKRNVEEINKRNVCEESRQKWIVKIDQSKISQLLSKQVSNWNSCSSYLFFTMHIYSSMN